jgi:hypothetical protein
MDTPPAEMVMEPTASPEVHVHDDGHQHTH